MITTVFLTLTDSMCWLWSLPNYAGKPGSFTAYLERFCLALRIREIQETFVFSPVAWKLAFCTDFFRLQSLRIDWPDA